VSRAAAIVAEQQADAFRALLSSPTTSAAGAAAVAIGRSSCVYLLQLLRGRRLKCCHDQDRGAVPAHIQRRVPLEPVPASCSIHSDGTSV
jgi:hypothetical protein